MTGSDAGPLIPRRRLGAAFRGLREARGETLQQTAAAVLFSPSKLSRLENGVAGEPHPRDVRDVLNHFGVMGDDRATLEVLAEAARQPGWWQVPAYDMPSRLDTFIAYESTADKIEAYVPIACPGALQIEEYARAAIQGFAPYLSADAVEAQVALRLERARRLRGRGVQQVYALPETVLYRWAGAPAVMSAQLAALLDAIADPAISLHVIPFTAGFYEAADLSTITAFVFDDPDDDDVVAIERPRFVEFLSRPATVEKYRRVFADLTAYWLDPDESSAFIERVRNEKWRGE